MTGETVVRAFVVLAALTATSLARALDDPVAGQRVYQGCAACHPISADGRHGVGPNLRRVIGRKAGSAQGYAYSAALRQSTMVWTVENLRYAVGKPRDAVPTCRSVGVRNPQQVENVLAYLKTVK